MKPLDISPDFTIEDIHKIREYNYEMTKNMTRQEKMDYYNNKKVESWKEVEQGIYNGIVTGSGNNKYIVHVNKFHPRKSTCNWPFADGRRVVCKHMIALYFTAEPNAATDFMKEVEKWEEEEELREQEHYEDLRQYVKSLSKTELQEQLLDALIQLEERRDYYW